MKLLIKYLIILNVLVVLHVIIAKRLLSINPKLELYNFLSIFVLLKITILPVIEEFIYRLGLRFKPSYFAFFIASNILYCGILINNFINDKQSTIWISMLSLFFFLCVGIFFILKHVITKNYKKTYIIFKNNFTLIFYISLLLFTISHYTNYSDYSFLIKLFFLSFIFIGGYFFSKLRIKEGFLYTCILHILFIVSSNLLTHFLFN